MSDLYEIIRRIALRPTTLAIAGVLALAGAPAVSAQTGGVEFVAEPTPGSDVAPGGGYFLLEADPGSEVTQSISLRNDSGRTLRLRLAAVDATTGPLGGASYALPDAPRRLTGKWISLSRNAVTLAPGGGAIVAFTVAVPKNVKEGQHLAGLAVWVPGEAEGASQAPQGQAGATISVQTRRVVAVQVETPGIAAPHLTISGVEPAPRPDGLYLEIGVANDGTALTKGKGVIEVAEGDFEQRFDVDTFVPATSIDYPIRWTETPEDGEYSARVEIRYDGETAVWEGTFVVGADVIDELGERQVNSPGGSRVPWAAGLAVLVTLAGAGLVWAWRRRRVRMPVTAPSPAARSLEAPPPPPPPPPPARAPRPKPARVPGPPPVRTSRLGPASPAAVTRAAAQPGQTGRRPPPPPPPAQD